MTTVAVVDDHPPLRVGIIEILKRIPDVKVVGEAGSGPELENLLRNRVPDVLFLDISMPDFDIREVIPSMRERHPQTKIIIITIHYDEDKVGTMVRLGVDGYLVKEDKLPEYERAIEAVMAGGTYYSQHVVPIICSLNASDDEIKLTEREMEVLEVMATGATTKAIAKKLFIMPRTATTHLSNIYRKLGVDNRASAMSRAIQLGIISVGQDSAGWRDSGGSW